MWNTDRLALIRPSGWSQSPFNQVNSGNGFSYKCKPDIIPSLLHETKLLCGPIKVEFYKRWVGTENGCDKGGKKKAWFMHSILLLQAHPLHESSADSRTILTHTQTHTHTKRYTTLKHVFRLDRDISVTLSRQSHPVSRASTGCIFTPDLWHLRISLHSSWWEQKTRPLELSSAAAHAWTVGVEVEVEEENR